MDTLYVPPPGLLGWLDLGTARVGAVLIQSSPAGTARRATTTMSPRRGWTG